jgi:hypothetical protein
MSAGERDSWRALASDFALDLGMLEWAQGVIRTWDQPGNDAGLAAKLSQVTGWDSTRAAEFVRRARALPLPRVGFT